MARSKATVYLSSEVRGIVRRSQYINSAASIRSRAASAHAALPSFLPSKRPSLPRERELQMFLGLL